MFTLAIFFFSLILSSTVSLSLSLLLFCSCFVRLYIFCYSVFFLDVLLFILLCSKYIHTFNVKQYTYRVSTPLIFTKHKNDMQPAMIELNDDFSSIWSHSLFCRLFVLLMAWVFGLILVFSFIKHIHIFIHLHWYIFISLLPLSKLCVYVVNYISRLHDRWCYPSPFLTILHEIRWSSKCSFGVILSPLSLFGFSSLLFWLTLQLEKDKTKTKAQEIALFVVNQWVK